MSKPSEKRDELLAKINKNHNDQLSIERDERCVPVAVEILKEVVNHKDLSTAIGFLATDSSHKQLSKDMQLVMINMFLEKGIKINDTGYIFRLMTSVIDLLQEIMKINLEENLKRADTFVWGKPSIELNFTDLHNVLEKMLQETSTKSDVVIDNTTETVVEPETVDEKIDNESTDTV